MSESVLNISILYLLNMSTEHVFGTFAEPSARKVRRTFRKDSGCSGRYSVVLNPAYRRLRLQNYKKILKPTVITTTGLCGCVGLCSRCSVYAPLVALITQSKPSIIAASCCFKLGLGSFPSWSHSAKRRRALVAVSASSDCSRVLTPLFSSACW